MSGASAQDVQNALNDLPNLSPGLVQVTQSAANSYSVQFSASLGDVDLIEEVLRNVNATISEQVKGSPSGDAFQLNIENKTTGLFSFSDTSANVSLKKKILYLKREIALKVFFSKLRFKK